MIHFIKGILEEKRNDSLVIEAGGVGYFITCPAGTIQSMPQCGQVVKLLTSMRVREDGWQLYGFSSFEERDFYEMLISVSGIGPKAAIALLSAYTVDQLNKAITTEDEVLLSSISGIGKRTAGRIIVELKEKTIPVTGETNSFFEAREALISLGYSLKEAGDLLSDIKAEGTEQMLKEALQKTLNGRPN
jgi:Holliday junction DNA helicase RuvA